MRLKAGVRGLLAAIAAAAAANHSCAAADPGALPPLAPSLQQPQQEHHQQQEQQQQQQDKAQVHAAEPLSAETSFDVLRHEEDTSSGCTSGNESYQSTSASECSSSSGGKDACSINNMALYSSSHQSRGDDTAAITAVATGDLLRRISACGYFHSDSRGCASVGRCRHFSLAPLQHQEQQQRQHQPHQDKPEQHGLCLLEKAYFEELADNNCALEPRSTLLAVAKDLHELGAVDASVLHAARSSTNTSNRALCRLVTHAGAAFASAFEALVSLLAERAAPQQLQQQQTASSMERQQHLQLQPPRQHLWQQQQQQQKLWRALRRWAKLRRLLSA
ncbi:hypothetical protein ACSSS7_005390 [Eimeria intestinalis]